MFPKVIIERFLISVETCRSIDCVLIRMSSAVYELEEVAEWYDNTKSNKIRVIEAFLRDESVRIILRGLYDNRNYVIEKILRDPRFKILRPYIDLIEKHIVEAFRSGIKPKTIYSIEDRPPLWKIEYEEKRGTAEKTEYFIAPLQSTYTLEGSSKKQSKKPKNKGRAKLSIIWISLVILILLAVYLLNYYNIPSSFLRSNLLGSPTTTATTVYTTLTSSQNSNELHKFKIGFPGFIADMNTSHIWFWIRNTNEEPLIVLEGNNIKLYLVIHEPSQYNYIPAERAIVDKNWFKIYFNLQSIMSKLKSSGNYKLLIYPTNLLISIYVDKNSNNIFLKYYTNINLEITKSGEINSIYSVIFSSLNDNVLNTLRKLIWNGKLPKEKEEILWKLVSYASSTFSYDYDKANSVKFYIYDPLTFIEKKKGICVDYAIFYAVSLIASGFNKSYIFVVNTDNGWHAFSVAEINGIYYALEQHLPIPELSDYFQYSDIVLGAKIESQIYAYEIVKYGNYIRITFRQFDQKDFIDSYPEDCIDNNLILKTTIKLSQILHARSSLVVIPGSNVITYYNWKTLHLYTPSMVDEWATYIASKIAADLRKYTERISYIALQKSGPITISVYYK